MTDTLMRPIAYQGFARGQDIELIKNLNEKASQGISPDITFLLDCPEKIGLERALERNKLLFQEDQGRFEKEKMDFHRAVRKGYLDIAREEGERFFIIDASLTEDEVEGQILGVLSPYLKRSVR